MALVAVPKDEAFRAFLKKELKKKELKTPKRLDSRCKLKPKRKQSVLCILQLVRINFMVGVPP
jgi:hypothetical protein